MSNEGIESIGDFVTGSMAARAAEPYAGERAGHDSGRCLNCGTALVGDYCHACGQSGHIHRTLTAWWHDLAHGVLHLDGKIWRTLPLLIRKPGELTRRYIEGERAKFVSPVALFLFSVFLMFAVFSLVGGPTTSRSTAQNASAAEQSEKAAEKLSNRVEKLEEEKAEAAEKGTSTAEIDQSIAEATEALKMARATSALARQEGVSVATEIPEDVGGSLPDWVNKPITKVRGNPDLVAYKLQNNAYKFSWMLIPISVPFVWLLFMFRRKYRMYDHTVFVTYSLAFMTILTVAASLLRAVTGEDGFSLAALLFIPPFHMYRQLKGAYSLSRFSALWRTMVLLIFAMLAAGLFVSVLLGIIVT